MLAILWLCFGCDARADVPHWIWQDHNSASKPTNEVCFFRKTFTVDSKPTSALLTVAADDEAVVYLNGKVLFSTGGSHELWQTDGTPAGTSLVKPIWVYSNPAPARVKYQNLVFWVTFSSR